MKISTVNYFIGDAFKSFKRNKTISIATIITVLVTFIVLGTFSLVAENLNLAIGGLEDKIELVVYLNDDISPIDRKEVQVKINAQEGVKEINVVLKADVNGSLEAVRGALEKIDVEGVRINIIRGAVGGITESDIVLARASDAIIIGFNVRANAQAQDDAKEYGVEIRTYDIISNNTSNNMTTSNQTNFRKLK